MAQYLQEFIEIRLKSRFKSYTLFHVNEVHVCDLTCFKNIETSDI